uniref:Uncharacterized protein n=1 Tax=Rhabditophanes sp. KR3021 TaxID=114890 RepID=A0AC35TG17_9BILA
MLNKKFFAILLVSCIILSTQAHKLVELTTSLPTTIAPSSSTIPPTIGSKNCSSEMSGVFAENGTPIVNKWKWCPDSTCAFFKTSITVNHTETNVNIFQGCASEMDPYYTMVNETMKGAFGLAIENFKKACTMKTYYLEKLDVLGVSDRFYIDCYSDRDTPDMSGYNSGSTASVSFVLTATLFSIAIIISNNL